MSKYQDERGEKRYLRKYAKKLITGKSVQWCCYLCLVYSYCYKEIMNYCFTKWKEYSLVSQQGLCNNLMPHAVMSIYNVV